MRTGCDLESTAELFGLLAAPLRLRIVCLLFEGEQCVGDLTRRADTAQSTLSRHLAMLYRAGVLARRREGAQVFYRVADPRLQALRDCVCRVAAERAPGTGCGIEEMV
jgi:DNA-binding transcriptional ArsR family regulator